MSSLIAREREKYETIWSVPSYAKTSPGAQMLPVFQEMSQASPGDWVLDAGCGSGRGAVALRSVGFKVLCCDLTPEGLVGEAKGIPFFEQVLWEPIGSGVMSAWDWVYCCDVLEHIPPTFAMLVVSRLLDAARSGVFLNISTQPDNFGAWIGEPLHQTVQSFVQWRDQLNTIGRVIEARDMLISGCYLVKPR